MQERRPQVEGQRKLHCTFLPRRIDAAGLRVGAISVARPSLDDVFLEATGRRLRVGEEHESQDVEEAR